MTTTKNATAGDQLQAPDPAASAAPVVHDENPPATAAALDPQESTSYLKSIEENYSQYRAVTPIPWGNALAFNPGDAVNADHPQLQSWLDDGMVERVASSSSKSRRK